MTLPTWLRRTLKIGLPTLAVLLGLALVLGVVGVLAVRRPFPSHDGELALAGLSAPVVVHRDEYGIPHIYAQTIEDLFRAQGYVHAQDRFWEMDFRRHVTSGRLAELFGAEQLQTDTFLRTLGWRRVAETEWGMLSAETQGYLTAYAQGVDAWIEATGGPAATGRKALQYRVLGLQQSGYEIEPWDPIDSLAWLKAMAWDLRTNLESEIERATLLTEGLTTAQVDELFPTFPYDRQTPILSSGEVVDGQFEPGISSSSPPGGLRGGAGGELPATTDPAGAGLAELNAARGVLAEVGELTARLPALLGTGHGDPADTGLGSNSWVVSGDHTATGAPILVNDPHLGVSMPGIWYQIGLHCDCGYRVAGFSFSGVPGVVIGHNDRIAWGFTNLGADVTDLYLERIDGNRYEVDGQWHELQVRQETIRVAGGDDVTIEVRQTGHGPLVSDARDQLGDLAAAVPLPDGSGPGGGYEYGLSLAWTALRPGSSMEALFVLNQARDWDDFRQAAALFEVPAQNLIYADIDGNIGYQSPGVFPIRGAGDGRWPAPGWDSSYDWQGFVDFAQLPYVLNPPDGLLVTANQAVIGPQYQPLLTTDWGHGYRGDRIHELLAEATATGPLDVATMQRLLFDNHNNLADLLVPHLLRVATPAPSASEQAALDLLRGWDGQQPAGGDPGSREAADSAAAAYFNAVWRQLLMLTFDELPTEHQPGGGGRYFTLMADLLTAPDSSWWDQRDTTAIETRDDILARALSAGYQELAIAQGHEPASWRWGRMHTLRLREATFGNSGIGPVEALFNHGPVEVAGGTDVVNATSWNAAKGYEVTVVPSMRMVVDLADLDTSRWIQLTGNSGHPFHRNYSDQVELWRTGELIPLRWDRDSIEAAAVATLRLT